MERSGGGGETAAKATKLSSDDAGAGEDLLSALPDDVLVLILLRIDTAAAAGRTSVLSRRWRRVWALLPELRFPCSSEPHHIASALEAHEVALRYLLVRTLDAAPESVAAWLPVAARRLSGRLIFENRVPGGDGSAYGWGRGDFKLPHLEKATAVSLDLGFLGLFVPLGGVFARLSDLRLLRVQFRIPFELGDTVSYHRCPCLRRLKVHYARGLDDLSIHSKSLLLVDLKRLHGLRHLRIGAPMLKMLSVIDCFSDRPNQPSAIIVAPQLKFLNWMDPYGPSSLHLCQIKCLQTLSIIFLAYGPEGFTKNHASLRLLRRFKVIECLHITLIYPRGMGNFKNLMGDITGLPQAMVLNLSVSNEGHAFGASLFHLLKMCTGLRRLSLVLYTCRNLEAQSACPSGCVCDEPINWKTEELTLNCLQEVVIVDLKGTNHEVAFIRRLLSWVMMLKNMRITFDLSISESKARELRQMLSSFTRPDSHGEFYMYRNAGKKSQYLLAP